MTSQEVSALIAELRDEGRSPINVKRMRDSAADILAALQAENKRLAGQVAAMKAATESYGVLGDGEKYYFVDEIDAALKDEEARPVVTQRAIIVNGETKYVIEDRLSYADVAALAGKPGAKNLTMTYDRAAYKKSGSLDPGQSIRIVNGTIFNAVFTGNA